MTILLIPMTYFSFLLAFSNLLFLETLPSKLLQSLICLAMLIINYSSFGVGGDLLTIDSSLLPLSV